MPPEVIAPRPHAAAADQGSLARRKEGGEGKMLRTLCVEAAQADHCRQEPQSNDKDEDDDEDEEPRTCLQNLMKPVCQWKAMAGVQSG